MSRQSRRWTRRRLTAMSGLSAKVYSCGGEGDLLRGGGDGSLTFCVAFWPLGALLKNFRMPFFLGWSSGSESTSEGTGERDDNEDRSEESSAIFAAGVRGLLCVAGVVAEERKWVGWREDSPVEVLGRDASGCDDERGRVHVEGPNDGSHYRETIYLLTVFEPQLDRSWQAALIGSTFFQFA